MKQAFHVIFGAMVDCNHFAFRSERFHGATSIHAARTGARGPSLLSMRLSLAMKGVFRFATALGIVIVARKLKSAQRSNPPPSTLALIWRRVGIPVDRTGRTTASRRGGNVSLRLLSILGGPACRHPGAWIWSSQRPSTEMTTGRP
jgi:hypothetical protein